MNQSELARRLGISKGQVSKCKQHGMPVDSVEAAAEWRRQHLDPSWAKPAPQRRVPEAVERFMQTVPLLSTFSPNFIAAALIDAGIEATGDQAAKLGALIVHQWMEDATALAEDDSLQFTLPDCWQLPDDRLASELDALKVELLEA